MRRDGKSKGGRAADPPVASANPLVSCIIIFLNEEKFLADAVESVLAQTYANWELLLVDDGSSDSSKFIAMEYCERHPERIRYLTHEARANRGMSASRNLGLREARGEFAAFLDADDSWLPDKLKQQVALFEEHPDAVMICCATRYWHSWQANSVPDEDICTGDVRRDGRWVRALQQDRVYPGEELLSHLYPLGEGMTPSSSGSMVRRETALKVGGYDDTFRGLFEDQVFRAKMYLAGPIYVSSKCLDRYRQHEGSTSQVARASGQSRELRRRFLHWLKHYLDEIGYGDPHILWKLKRALLRNTYPRTYRFAARIARVVRSLSRQS